VTVVDDRKATEKPTLKMKWIVVIEDGKRELRTMWVATSATESAVYGAAA
jgi:hypothetical protein